MDIIENKWLSPFGEFQGDFSKNPVPTGEYYYSATGDVMPGSNTNIQQFSEFNYQPVRYPVGTPIDVRTQSDVWDVNPPNEPEASPVWDAALSVVAPVIDFFQGVVENFTGVVENLTGAKKVTPKKKIVKPLPRKH